jgi:hypothetical protein
MAVDLDFANSGLEKLKGNVVKESFTATTLGNKYLAVQQQDLLGNAQQTFFANSFDLKVGGNGKLQTAEGFVLTGYQLNNLGQVQVNDPNVATNGVTVRSAELVEKDGQFINKEVGLDQTLRKVSGDTWQWTVKRGNETLVDQSVEIKFFADGKLATIDGSVNFAKSATLNWGVHGTTTQSFDLEKVFTDDKARDTKAIQVNWFDGKSTASKTILPNLQLNANQAVANADFFSNVTTQNIKNLDKAIRIFSYNDPTSAPVSTTQTLTRVSGDNWQLTIKNGATTLLDKNYDLTFNPDGSLATINGVAATTSNETLNWGAPGTTNENIDIAGIFANSNEKTDVALTQTLTRVSGNTWEWQVKKGSEILNTQNVDLEFDSNGSLIKVDGEFTGSKKITVNYGSYVGDTEQTFALDSIFKKGDFSQVVRVTDNIGVGRDVRIDYSRTGAAPDNRWQAKVWNEATGKLAASIDFRFDSNGRVISVGNLDTSGDTDPPVIKQADGRQSAKAHTFSLDWGIGTGSSELTLDFENVFSQGGSNREILPTKTDSIELGKRKGVNIDENGNVIATYAKKDGTGDININLYRLATSSFDSPNALRKDDKTGYLSAGVSAGFNNVRPLGTDKDFNGVLLEGFSGKLTGPTKKTSERTILQVIGDGYNQNVYEQALGQENNALRYAVYFKANAGKIDNIYNILGDRALRDVVSTVFSIPERVATQPVATQAALFERKVDVKKFKDPQFVDQFIQRFLALSGDTGGNQASNFQTQLIGGTADSSSLLTLAAQNLNVLV